ncbi:GNAT family N-acetyltransferase [Actinomadura sp. ATCC 31491]|uniref:GNAT family N-acetyltransferase n=1 Tax=Actinomadura luzonensis TaxID=2805427 RepID=A0ABT0FTR1_9ACTN|nr:GNAT family N-acetyltransferase [Actinomadura luzonensis]MCK2215723.1 GNAT family N-acetyltransferase [Actinomadura luzonensis]
MIEVRRATPGDAGALLGLQLRLDRESAFMLLEPGERDPSAGRGLGRRLLERAVTEARQAGLARLELTVMCHNRPALGLYLACGFQVEGLRRSALEVGGRRVDEYYMGLLLE